MMTGISELQKVVEAMHDPRVLRVLALAERDQRIRRLFRQRKKEEKAYEVIRRLSEEFFLSEEHIRTIVYRKGRKSVTW